ncbi:PqiB family protein [Chitinimonas naiadis]
MSDTPEQPSSQVPGKPQVVRPRWRFSPIWLVPIIAGLVGLSMLFQTWYSAGPKITISFQSAAGLEVGKTQVRYKNVIIGHVVGIRLSEDHAQVRVKVALNKDAESFARTDSRFWVVRPRIGVGGISGIDTVLSGAYIEVDSGSSTETLKDFTGLENPPTVTHGTPGKGFALHAADIGSLDIGSPVYYRRIPVGQVASYQLDADGKGVTVQVFIYAPNDRFVTADSRFWNASGLDVSLSADGFKLNTQSVATVLAGGIAFATPDYSRTAAPENTRFDLASDEKLAMAGPDGPPQYLRMRFDQSLRGLAPDAPVEFLGINIGRVEAVYVDYDPVKQRFPVIVDAVVYPRRLGHVHEKTVNMDGDEQLQTAQFVRTMVDQGLRAQARTGNLLTGQLFISFDFVPNAPKVPFDVKADPLIMPTVRGSFDKLQEQFASIVAKVDKIPLDAIGRHLDDNLQELNKTLKQVNGQVLPEARTTMQEAQSTMKEAKRTFNTVSEALGEDAPLQQDLGQTLQELQRSARSLRTLTDMLGRHPEALLRGRPAGSSPPPAIQPQEPAR